MKELMIIGVSFISGFIGAYAFDTLLTWWDDRKWQ